MWSTRLTRRFPCRLPIVVPPMNGVSGGRLAAETTRAGGLGFFAPGHLQPADVTNLQQEIRVYRELLPSLEPTEDAKSAAPVNLGLIGHSAFGSKAGWGRFEQVLDQYRPDVVQCFAPAIARDGDGRSNVHLAQEYGAKFLAQVTNLQEAVQAVEAGVDGLMVQGQEAGGHGRRLGFGHGTLGLCRTVVKELESSDVAIVAAGGIADGPGLIAALALGCDGIVVGTRMSCSMEALTHESFKQRLVESTVDDVLRTTVFDQIQNAYSTSPWPIPYDSVGSLRNETTSTWEGRSTDLADTLASNNNLLGDYRQALTEGNADVALVHAGEGVGLVRSIESAYDILQEIDQDARHLLQSLPERVLSS